MKKLSLMLFMLVGIVMSAMSQTSIKGGMIVTNDGETIKAYNIDYSSQDYCYYTLSEKSDDLKRIKKSEILIIKTEDGKKIDPSANDVSSNANVSSDEGEDEPTVILPGNSKPNSKKTINKYLQGSNPDAHEPVTHYVRRPAVTQNKEKVYVSEDERGGNLLNMRIINEDKRIMSVAPEGDNLEYEDAVYIIPEYVELDGKTYTVEEVSEKAFGYRWSNKDIRQIIMPRTLKRIRNQGFYNLVKLERIVLPESIESIGTNSFTGCGNSANSFEGIYIPKTLENIGSGSFHLCGRKTSYRGFYQGYIMEMPDWINEGNCLELGIDEEAVESYRRRRH